MTPDPEVAEALERLDRALEHPRILAAKAVAEFRGREQSQGPVINQHDDKGGRRLDVDGCIQCSQPNHAVTDGLLPRKPLIRRLCWWR